MLSCADDINLLAERPYLRITGTIVQEKGVGTFRQDEGKSEKATLGGHDALVRDPCASGCLQGGEIGRRAGR